MTDAQKKFLEYILKYVGQPYVWGGAGEVVTKINYLSKINDMETSGGYEDISYKEAAIKFCNKLFAKGQTKLTIFDCSGYISKALMAAGLATKRRDCDGIWTRCTRTSEPADFTLLFRVSPRNSEDETHIGVYYQGYQYHAKGRKYGVVKEKYKASYWNKMGTYPGLSSKVPNTTSSTSTSGYVFRKLLKKPMFGSGDVKELKKLLIAKGYGNGITATNGNFLSSTEAVVTQFQKDMGLKADGIVGRDTLNALGATHTL